MAEDLFLRGLELFGSKLELVPGEIQIVRAVDGYEVEMGMRDLEAYYGEATTITGKSLLYRFGDGPGEHQDLAQISIGHVKEFIDLDLGYDKRMSFP